jgi:hypothetical protein
MDLRAAGGAVQQAAQSFAPPIEQSTLAMPAGGWMPQSYKDQVPGLLAMMAAQGPDPGADGFRGGGGPRMNALPPQYIESNWGPPPALNEGQDSWFPSVFSNRDPRATNKFWTMKDYNQQRINKYGGQPPEVGDERPNTFNSALFGGAPGNFMYLGHQISPAKLQYDLHRPISDPMTAGSIHFTKAFGPDQTAWSTTGELGLPGQLEPFAQMWGAGGP